MKKQINFIDEVKNLLFKNGVNERKIASTIASILGIHYNSAKQKIDGKRGISLDEIKLVFKYFNEDFVTQRTHNCVFIMNNIHKRCNVKIHHLAEIISSCEDGSFATKKDEMYIINTNKPVIEDKAYKVESIDFLPAPKIAILDNNSDILVLLQKIANRYGMDADIYKTTEELQRASNLKDYEAFILDWLLDFNLTPEELIKTIRQKHQNQPIIIILTGELTHHEKMIGEMIMDYQTYLVEKPAKPLIISSLLLSKLFFN